LDFPQKAPKHVHVDFDKELLADLRGMPDQCLGVSHISRFSLPVKANNSRKHGKKNRSRFFIAVLLTTMIYSY
jgi:hypothetical protein